MNFKIHVGSLEDQQEILKKLKETFEPQGIPVLAISAVSGKGMKELLYHVKGMLNKLDDTPIVFEREFNRRDLVNASGAFTVSKQDEHTYVVEGPRIDRMLGYTNLDSEKGFEFFQNFLKEQGILKQLEELGIQESDTVRMYGLQFDYYK